MITEIGDAHIREEVNTGKHVKEWGGLSTDEKPADAKNGSTFLEMDTGKVFMFDGANNVWREL